MLGASKSLSNGSGNGVGEVAREWLSVSLIQIDSKPPEEGDIIPSSLWTETLSCSEPLLGAAEGAECLTSRVQDGVHTGSSGF